MPISYYAGKPRHGKSYSVMARVVIPALKAGRTVVTNIPVLEPALQLPGKVHQLKRGKSTMRDIADLLLLDKDDETGDYKPNMEFAGAVFVLDEFMFLCSSGVKTAAIDEKVKAFFAMHGHVNAEIGGHSYSTEIVLMSQDASQICAMVKAMVDQSFLIEKTLVGSKKLWTAKIYSGCVGVNTGAAKATYLRTEQGTYDPEIFPYYKSQTLGEGHGDESKTDDATNLLNLKAFRYGLPLAFVVLPLLIWFAAKSFTAMFGGKEQIDSAPSTQTAPPAKPVSPSPASHQDRPSVAKEPMLQDVQVYTAGHFEEGKDKKVWYKLIPKDGSEMLLTEQELYSVGVRIQRTGNLTILVDGDSRRILFPSPQPKTERDPYDMQPLADGAKSVW